MRFNVRGENLEITPALREYAERKVSRLKRYFADVPDLDVQITMRVVREAHTVEVTLLLPRLLLRAEETSADMYSSIDLVVDKLERQIRKYKTKIYRKFRQDGSLRDLMRGAEPENGQAFEEEELEIPIVRVKRFNLKPMDPEEAVLQMNLLGHNFFVFANAENHHVNVVYRRKDGTYGLIDPEA